MSRKKTPAKRRRRSRPQLTTEQRIEIEMSRRAAEQRLIARCEHHWSDLICCVEGEHYGSARARRNRCDQWELTELARMNDGRAEPRHSLPDRAYEARRLWRYAE